MPPRKHERIRRRKRRAKLALVLLIFALVIAIIVVGAMLAVQTIGNLVGGPGRTTTTTTPPPREPAVVATATVGNSGDILIHNGVRKSAYNSATGQFDFTESFRWLAPFVSKVDYAVVNAEFSVSTGSSYAALPFRVPTAVVKALKDCGYDMGLTANNHIGDGGVAGIKKTMQTLAEYGMDFTGSRQQSSDKRYLVKEVNGIKIGFLNYTYGSYWNTNGFSNTNLTALYNDASALITAMRAEGAELVYMYLHWGNEYALEPNETQEKIAQAMCDLGVDVIVGGHPHKIQPLELLTSTDGTHNTICLYSSGNLLSGQQVECMAGGTRANSPYCYQDSWHYPGCDYPDVADRTKDTHRLEHGPTCNDNGHTEDGLLFNVTASRFEDGSVMITGVDVLPVWCMGRGFIRAGYPTNSTFEKYLLVPLDKNAAWKTAYGLTGAEITEAGYSYDRTMALVGEGLTAINANCQNKLSAYVEAFKQAQLNTTQTTTVSE